MAAMTSGRLTPGGRSFFTPDGVRVHRRLDRTLEPADQFSGQSRENKAKLYRLRSAVWQTKIKMDRQREDLEEKDALIEKERQLRLAAEEQLSENLVDMYGDPSVNEELRHRLPHSSPSERHEHYSPKFSGHRSPKLAMTSPGCRGVDRSAGHLNREVRRSLDFDVSSTCHSKPETRPRAHSEPVRTDLCEHARGADGQQQSLSGSGQPPGNVVLLCPMDLPVGMTYLHPVPAGTSAPSHPHSAVLKTPVPVTTMVVSPATPQLTTAGPSSASPPGPPPTSAVLVPVTVTGGHHAAPSPVLTASYVGGPHAQVVTPQTTTTVTPTQGSPSTQQVAYLLEELKLERARNKNLQEKLEHCQDELELSQRTLRTKEVETDASTTSQVSAVIEEIRQAQAAREAAVLGRLEVANREKDTMYLQLKQYGAIPDETGEFGDVSPPRPLFGLDVDDPMMLDGTDQYTIQNLLVYPDEQGEDDDFSADEFLELDFDELLRKLCSQTNPKMIELVGDSLACQISDSQRRREEAVAEEMQIVLEERDIALAKCQKLEKQLYQLERKENPFCTTPKSDRSLKAELARAYNELRLSQSKVEGLEEELQTLSIYHSLGKDVLTSTKMNNTVDLYEVQLQEKDNRMDHVQKENNLLLSQLRAVNEDLVKTRAAYKESQENSDRLVRMVRVLKRKLNANHSDSEPIYLTETAAPQGHTNAPPRESR